MPVLPLVGSTMRVSGRDQALGLGGLDHGDADAVLDAAQGVLKLQFGQDGGRAPAAMVLSRTRGVEPTACMMSGRISLILPAPFLETSG